MALHHWLQLLLTFKVWQMSQGGSELKLASVIFEGSRLGQLPFLLGWQSRAQGYHPAGVAITAQFDALLATGNSRNRRPPPHIGHISIEVALHSTSEPTVTHDEPFALALHKERRDQSEYVLHAQHRVLLIDV